jgi:hypothetical protein
VWTVIAERESSHARGIFFYPFFSSSKQDMLGGNLKLCGHWVRRFKLVQCKVDLVAISGRRSSIRRDVHSWLSG